MSGLRKMTRFCMVLLAIASVVIGTASARPSEEPYRFEMVVFERAYDSGSEAWPDLPGEPERQQAIDELIGTEPSGAGELGPVVYTLRRRGMTVHSHLIWQQVPGPRAGGGWRWLDAGRLQGLVRVSRGRFLHLDTDLILRSAGSATPYRIKLNRRMRSNELHYVDHPRVGIVIQALRVETEAEPADDERDGEPKPLSPATNGATSN